MMGSGMFDGIMEAFVALGIVIGLVICVAVAIPVYYYGKSNGKDAIYQECVDRKLLKIEYSPTDGQKLYIWKEVK
jgi:hypothetical protein